MQCDRRRGPKRPFPRRYTKADIGLLAEVDETLGGLCGAVTRRMMQRQYAVFGDVRFERLAGLSASGFGPSGRPGRGEGSVRDQSRGRGHAVRVRGRRGGHLGAFPGFRPCHFPGETIDAERRKRKTYSFDNVTTPYLKLKSLDGAALTLRPGVNSVQLDQQALAPDDLASCSAVNEARVVLFAEIHRRDATVA